MYVVNFPQWKLENFNREETQGRHEMLIEGNDDIELNEYIKMVADEVLM